MIYEYKVNNIKYNGLRLDKYISLELTHLSRSKIKLLINNKMVLVNGKRQDPDYRISLKDKIKVTVIATGFSINETEELSDNILENKIDGLMPESQINLFDSDTENNEIEFLSSSNQEEEVVHDIDDDYEEDEDILEPEYSESNINDRSENVIIEELDSVDDSNDKFDISNKKNEYLLKREDRINDYKNQIYDKDSYEEKLAIPAFKRKNINLSTDDDIINNNTKTINFNEED